MYGPSGRAQSWSTFNHRQPTPVASSSPAPYLYPIVRPSRSSSVTVPSPKSGPRFRTAVRPERHDDRELRQKLSKSRLRLLSSFDAIADKYGSVPPEEDDEIDLFECDITKDNGHLESLEPRLFADGNDYVGEAIEDEDGIRLDLLRQQSEPVRGPEQIEFGDDEDELGDWGNKSGLDAQYPVVEIENDWTADDLNDLDEFMRAEAARRARYGEESLPVFERPSVASSPLRNLRHLVLDASPEVEEAVMDESELPKGSRVSSGGREAFPRRSPTPPPITHQRGTGSAPRRRPRPRHSDILELSRSSSSRRDHLPRELSRTINGLSRSASGHIVQYEEVTTRVVTVQGQAQAARSRKDRERILPPPPLWERDRQALEPVRRPSSRSSALPGSGGPSSARSIQEVTTVRRRETWVSPPSSGRQPSGGKRPSHRPSPPPLWPSPPAQHPQHTQSSSSAPPSSPLTRQRIHRRESGPHLQKQYRSRVSLRDTAPNPRIIPVEEDTRDVHSPAADEQARTPSPRRRCDPASLLASLHLWTVPPEGTAGYSSELSSKKGTPRACKSCSKSSGDRARLAVYCRGRTRPHLCAYYEEGFDTAAAVIAVAKEFSPRTAETSPQSPRELPPPPSALRLPPLKNEPGYMQALRVVNGIPRRCRACKDAGGERGEWAPYCRGRYRRRFCAHYNTRDAADTVSEAESSEAALQPPHILGKEPPSTSPRSPQRPPKDHPSYVQTLTVINGVVRCCRACKDAGGERGALAGYCRGRHRPRFCAHYGASEVAEAAPEADPLVPPKDHPGYFQNLVESMDTVRFCGACATAGGNRAALAGYCRGRVRPALCAHFESNDGPPAFHAATAVDMALAQPLSRVGLASLSTIGAPSPSFEDKTSSGGEPAEPAIPPRLPTRNCELSPDSSGSDTESSDNDDYDDDRFSAYNSSAAEDDTDDDRHDDGDEGGNASEDEAQSAPSETDSDTSVLSTGYGDAQLLVDITPGAEANYTLPPNEDGFSKRLIFRDVDGVYGLATCAHCVEAGGEHADRALWCSGREAGGACPLAPNAAPNSLSRRTTCSQVNALDDLFTPPPSDSGRLRDDLHGPHDDAMDAGIGGYYFGKDVPEHDAYPQDAEPRTERTRPRSAPTLPSVRFFTRPASLSGVSKSSPPRAAIAQAPQRPAQAGASVLRTSHAELDARGAGVNVSPPPNERSGSIIVDRLKPIPTLASSVSRTSYTLQAPVAKSDLSGLMLPPPLPRSAASAPSQTSTSSAPQTTPSASTAPSNPRAPRTTPRKRFRDPDSDSEPELPATAPRERAPSVISWDPPLSTPRKKTRMELRAEREASLLDDAHLEWGLDLEAGLDVARTFREGSILLPVSDHRWSGAEGAGGEVEGGAL